MLTKCAGMFSQFSFARLLIFLRLFYVLVKCTDATYPFFGTRIGKLSQLHHGVSGDVYAVDSRTLFIKNFNYDGEAPAAYFYVGNTEKPSGEGWRLYDEKGKKAPLTTRYRSSDITLSLPEGKTFRDIKWFSVWCEEFSVNFGDVKIPKNLNYPKPQKIGYLKGVHGVSSDNIVIVDAQTILIPNFSYDGEAPDAKFWVGRGTKPTPQGLRIPDENGKETPLKSYDKKTIVLTLPNDLTIFDIGHFGVWCEAFTVDFGHIQIPDGLNVPPSLKMLGISPQSKLNCEVLRDDLAFEVRWAVAGESVVIQLVAKLEINEYMSFGISSNSSQSNMIGSDVAVAWIEKGTGKGFAKDYFLKDKSQCSGASGSCPDTTFQDNTNSVRLLNAAMVNGYSIITYQRPLKASDQYDLSISTNSSQAVVWAIGPLNERQEVSFHSAYTMNNHLLDFGRQPQWNCLQVDVEKDVKENKNNNKNVFEKKLRPEELTKFSNNKNSQPVPPQKVASLTKAWDIPEIKCHEPEDGVFYAQLGPTGGKHGYSAITGHVGWGISWYINGLLIPKIHVVRGKTYTFVVEGGNDPEIPAKYHPFYITDDPVGGFQYKTDEERKLSKVFAGIDTTRSGKIQPTGVGRLCNWTPDQNGPPADDFQSFGAYQRSLHLVCQEGEPGIITWTPDENTPDIVYYHCFTHRYLGWKIYVHDECKISKNGSFGDFLSAESSIIHETRVKSNDVIFKNKNNVKDTINDKIQKTLTDSDNVSEFNDITKLISNEIKIAETLEENLGKNKNQSTNLYEFYTAPSVYRKTNENNVSRVQIQNMPAINLKEKSVVVEGGFRPIVRRQTEESINLDKGYMIRRQDKIDTEIDEAMETDNLFLYKPIDENSFAFEPIFVPSPPDNNNVLIKSNNKNSFSTKESLIKDAGIEDISSTTENAHKRSNLRAEKLSDAYASSSSQQIKTESMTEAPGWETHNNKDVSEEPIIKHSNLSSKALNTTKLISTKLTLMKPENN